MTSWNLTYTGLDPERKNSVKPSALLATATLPRGELALKMGLIQSIIREPIWLVGITGLKRK